MRRWLCRKEGWGEARPSFLQMAFVQTVLGFHLPGDEWLLCGQQLLPVHRGQMWTQHSRLPAAHGPLAKESGGNQVQNRKGGGCAHSPEVTGCLRKLQILEVSVILIY